jgi:hypothetical protein
MWRGRHWLRRRYGSISQSRRDCWTTSTSQRSFRNRRFPRNAWQMSRLTASMRSAREKALVAPRYPKPTCPAFRSRRPLIPLARKQLVVERRRKARAAKRSPLAAPRCISPAIHPSRQSSAKIPTPTAPRSRAAPHRRKPRRRRGTPCPFCGSPTARSPWPSACRHGQQSPSWTPSRQRHRIPSRRN